MAFNSFHFAAFFPIVLILYFSVPRTLRPGLLFIASCYFYMAWRPEYIVLLLGATLVCFYGGLKVAEAEQESAKRRYTTICLLLLLGVLFVFKYFNFANDSVREVVSWTGGSYPIGAIDLILPIGISFYTFQLLSYVIDVQRGATGPERSLGTFALYGSFFPQLVAGPIERANNLMPQLKELPGFDYDRVVSGLRLMLWGFFKKTVVADRLAPFVQDIYSSPGEYEALGLAVGTFFFAFQVYCDFSGYSDIAIGAARTLGVDLMTNFRQPYFATSISEFWKRWHISLSTWLTDYVYTPLTRTRYIKLGWYNKFLLALLLTFLVSGVWHGAAWTYVIWGGLHGTYLVCSMLSQKLRRRIVKNVGLAKAPRFHAALQATFTFLLVCISYIFFRAESVADAFYILTTIVAGTPAMLASITDASYVSSQLNVRAHLPEFVLGVLGILTVITYDAIQRFKPEFGTQILAVPTLRWSTYAATTFAIVVLGAFYENASQFIYFQF